jgi:hypothetical protein
VSEHSSFESYEHSLNHEDDLPPDMWAAAGIFIGTLLGAIAWLLMLLAWL